jgi:hypothetical protein
MNRDDQLRHVAALPVIVLGVPRLVAILDAILPMLGVGTRRVRSQADLSTTPPKCA